MTSRALEINPSVALDRLLDGLCDGAIFALGLYRSPDGTIRTLTISPKNWQMHKYYGTPLHYDAVQIVTVDLIKWLRLDTPPDRVPGKPDKAALSEANKARVKAACVAIYKACSEQGVRAPNVITLPKAVKELLQLHNQYATYSVIREVADSKDIADYRSPRGIKTALKEVAELQISKSMLS